MAKNIMVQGTASSVGKSIINAALCRIFLQDGHKVAPFKSQNMALNSFVTSEGLEMGRAQVVQAEACGLEPNILMNPILLKPTSDKKAQVILNGKVFKNLGAKDYHNYKPLARDLVKKAYYELESKFDIIVLEGAGSPAEINLRDKDIVNMGMADIADAPVVLVADIDKGGVFASIVGTIFLLSEKEKNRVKGIIINKFRGDIEILKPGLAMLEDIIKIPVLGVIPYARINLEDEDSVTERFNKAKDNKDIDIRVIRLPHISNASDFDVFNLYEDVNLTYAKSSDDIGNPDILILPGSKNTIEDLNYIWNTGAIDKIKKLHEQGKLIIGICSGYQMLGNVVKDPYGIEGDTKSARGIGFFNMDTIIANEKITTQIEGEIISGIGALEGLKGNKIKGYEIHMGKSTWEENESYIIETAQGKNGAIKNNTIGTYIHGIFDSAKFTRGLLNNIRKSKGLAPIENRVTFEENKEQEFNKLADIVRYNIDMKKIYNILNGERIACN